MKKMRIQALNAKPTFSRCRPAHAISPYQLRNVQIARSHHVFAANISSNPMKRGFVNLFAVMDWASRRVLPWRLSNTLTTEFCIEAVQEAIDRYGMPEIFNTDQGYQFTSFKFTPLFTDNGIALSMDGRGYWHANVFAEQR